MTSTPSRRDFGFAIAAARGPGARRPVCRATIRALGATGLRSRPQASTPSTGGHRERAMRLIEHAMGEVQAGIDFAYQHGGGGY